MRNLPPWLFLLAVTGFVVATALCSVVAFLTTQSAAVALGDEIDISGLDFRDWVAALPTSTPTPQPEPTATPSSTEDIIPAAAVTEATPEPTEEPAPDATPDPLADIPQWEQLGQTTILLMGIDQRSGFDTDRAYRTDTMILMSIDPLQKRVGMLSIPRDLFVTIPGYSNPDKINTANYLGDLADYPGGGGPALAAETVRANFGIPVDYFVRINFDVFETAVDTLAPNGIEVCIEEEIYDPKYPDAGYGTIEVRFEPGCQNLDSTRLLQYARTRATQGGDFDRARRQQQVLKAAQRHFLNLNNLTSVFTQIPTLFSQLSDNVETNLDVAEIIALARLATEIDSDSITSGQIDTRHITGFGKNDRGEDVVIPNWIAIRQLMQDIFNPQPDLTLADLRERAQAENARVVVFNDTTVAGLAGQTRDWLASRQVTVENVGNMPEPSDGRTVIRDYTGKRWTARYLAALMGLSNDAVVGGGDGLTSADVMVVVGNDVQPLLTGSAAPTATPDGG